MNEYRFYRSLMAVLMPVLFFLLLTGGSAFSETLKLSDVELEKVIELYSRETGKNVFVDDTVQKKRLISSHLQGMKIEEAFGIILKTVGLEYTDAGSNTVFIYPPERGQRYKSSVEPGILSIPGGIDGKWVISLLSSMIPSLKSSLSSGDEKSLILYGSETQLEGARNIVDKLPQIAVENGFMAMSDGEKKLAAKDVKFDGTVIEAGATGLNWSGSPSAVEGFRKKLESWRKSVMWGRELFTPKNIEFQKILKASEGIKGNCIIVNLGDSGSAFIEGPQNERMQIVEILNQIDQKESPESKEIRFGEIKPELAREALKKTGVSLETVDGKNFVLSGTKKKLEEASSILKMFNRKKKQILIKFRLAEVASNKLKTLGIDLDKSAYTYGEIKEFHAKDNLPLLLRIFNERKGATILAEPNLRVLEGEEAKVTIGERIPLEVAATAQTESGSTLKLNTQLNWVDVGIKMIVNNVAVNSDESIKMDLKSEVSSIVGTTKQGFPQIRTREAESVLRLKNGDSIVMGGLLSNEERESQNRIPFISRIPLFGGLAKGYDKQKNATEIIMVVTAILVKD
ncbi:MAG: hypothetical protein HQM10_19360 [Candidatus Riflebacteria bacterium]|nr:hypothetical protein [Candidatus Riflebacteria bacterium]